LVQLLFCSEGGDMYALSVQRSRSFIVVCLATLGAVAAQADMNGALASPAARYEVERAMCLRGESSQDLTTCLREAGAAKAQAKRGEMHDESTQFAANRFQRCERLPDEQRLYCIARMHGLGTTSGSVAGGGIYRELVIFVEDGSDSDRKDPNR
jgi:hypothetical protein